MSDDVGVVVPTSRRAEPMIDVRVTQSLPLHIKTPSSCPAPLACATKGVDQMSPPAVAATDWTELSLSGEDVDNAGSRYPTPPTVIVTAPPPGPRTRRHIPDQPSGTEDPVAPNCPRAHLPRARDDAHRTGHSSREPREVGQRQHSTDARKPDTLSGETITQTCGHNDHGLSVVNSQPSSPPSTVDILSTRDEHVSPATFRSLIPLGNETEFAAINRLGGCHNEPPSSLPHFLTVPTNFFTAAVTSTVGRQLGHPHGSVNRAASTVSDGQLPLGRSPARGEVRLPMVRPFGTLPSPWSPQSAHPRDGATRDEGPQDGAPSCPNDGDDESDRSGAAHGFWAVADEGHLSRRRRRASVVQVNGVTDAAEEPVEEDVEQLLQVRLSSRTGRAQRSARRRPLAIAKWRTDGTHAYASEDLCSSRSMAMVLRRSGYSITMTDTSLSVASRSSGPRYFRDPPVSPLPRAAQQDALRLSHRPTDGDGMPTTFSNWRVPASSSITPLFMRTPPSSLDGGSRALGQRLSSRWSPYSLNKASTPRLVSTASSHDDCYIPDTDDINRRQLLNAKVMYNEHLAEREAAFYTGGDAGEVHFFNAHGGGHPQRVPQGGARIRATTPGPLSLSASSGHVADTISLAECRHSQTLPWGAEADTAAGATAVHQSASSTQRWQPLMPAAEAASHGAADEPVAVTAPRPPTAALPHAGVGLASTMAHAPEPDGLTGVARSPVDFPPPAPGPKDVDGTAVGGPARLVPTSQSMQVTLPLVHAQGTSASQLGAAILIATASLPPPSNAGADGVPATSEVASPCAPNPAAVSPTRCETPKVAVPQQEEAEAGVASPPPVTGRAESPVAYATPSVPSSKVTTPSSRPRAKSHRRRGGSAAAPRAAKCIPADIFWDVNVSLPLRNVRLTMSPAPPLFM